MYVRGHGSVHATSARDKTAGEGESSYLLMIILTSGVLTRCRSYLGILFKCVQNIIDCLVREEYDSRHATTKSIGSSVRSSFGLIAQRPAWHRRSRSELLAGTTPSAWLPYTYWRLSLIERFALIGSWPGSDPIPGSATSARCKKDDTGSRSRKAVDGSRRA
jgi:hypothetical protein